MSSLRKEFTTQTGTPTSPEGYEAQGAGFDGRYVQWLEEKVIRARELGCVYVHPGGWSAAKAGGLPDLDECEQVDLSDL